MPVEEEQVQQFLQVIQGGKQFPLSSAEMLTADNGDPLFNVVNQATYAWNGLVADAYGIVTLGAGAVATGMALLTAPVSAPVVAVGLTLGLTSGYLLYDLQPEFFNDIAEQLEAAGQTIGGKVIGFINDTGITGYSQQTIEIIKNALLAVGAFDAEIESPEIPAGQYTATNKLSINDVIDIVVPYWKIGANDPFDRFGVTIDGLKNAVATYMANNNIPSDCAILAHAEQTAITFFMIKQQTFRIKEIGSGVDTSFIIDTNSSVLPWSERWFLNCTPISSGGQYVWSVRNSGAFTEFPNKGLNPTYDSKGNSQDFGAPTTQIDRPEGSKYAQVYFRGFGVTQITNTQDGATLPTGDPISTTYPEWNPLPAPQELPDIYPVSEPAPDGAQDPAQTGENDAPEQIQSIWDKIFIPEPPTPIDPSPEPVPEPDPDPQPVPDPIPEPDPAEQLPDPLNPNPPIEPSPLPIVPVLPSTVGSNAMFTVYRPSISQLNSFGGWLWDNSIIEQLLRMWSNPLEGIIAFQKVYASPTIGGSSNIIVGYLDSGVAAPVVTSQFVTVNCGTISVAEKMHNATDYSPYTSMHLYLPFIGIVELDITEFMNGSINVKYSIDVYTGTCLAEVRAIRQADMPNATIIYTFSGNASQQLPLTSSNFAGALSALVSAVGGGIAIASGGGIAALAGATAIGHSLTHEMVHIGRSGALSANAGIMGARTPFIILGRRNGYDANAYNELYGYPANKTVYLSNCNGYTRVKAGFLRSKATENEKNEIMSFLKKGVIL